MRKISFTIPTLILISLNAVFSPSLFAQELSLSKTTLDTYTLQSRSAIQPLAKQLKVALQGAMKTGGPIKALSICNTQAPVITQNITKHNNLSKPNITVSRTSLKYRNASNAPDLWEKKVLTLFQQALAAGKNIKHLEFSETVSTDQGDVFRFMKAIPTQKMCLACHGQNITSEVQKQINLLYPQDNAVGFKAGDIRGAFSTKLLLSKKKYKRIYFD